MSLQVTLITSLPRNVTITPPDAEPAEGDSVAIPPGTFAG